MNRLAQWWRRVLGGAPPLERSSMSEHGRASEIDPDRMKIIDLIRERQHRQGNEIAAETGHRYVTRAREEAARAIHRERIFWEKHGHEQAGAGDDG